MFTTPLPVSALSDSYQTLESRLNESGTVTEKLQKNLPEPETVKEYHLRSKIRDDYEAAISDLDKAIKLGDRIPSEILSDWLDMVLLGEPSSERFNLLKTVLEGTNNYSGEIWYLAAKYAAYFEKYELAKKYNEKALSFDSVRSQALLDRAEYFMQLGESNKALRVLDQFFLQYQGKERPRYWNLRGKILERTTSDSDAYLAYSHLIRNYPESLELSEAESRIADLPLPKAFKPNKPQPAETSGKNESADSTNKKGSVKIQIGSFQSEESAKRFKKRKEKQIIRPLTISSAMVDGARYHRVQVTGFDSKYDAQQFEAKLEEMGIEAFILD